MSDSFEWYYFDIHTNSGFDVVFTLHVKPFMSRFEISVFDFFVYKDNKRLMHHFFSRPQNELLRAQGNDILKYNAQNYLRKTGDTFKLRFTDEKITFDLRLESLLPTDRPPEVNLLPQPGPEEYFKWVIFAPVCKASGSLVFKEEEIRLEGRGYHDYNGGNINLKKVLKGWYWGKFFEADKLTILGQITDRGGRQKNVLVSADENELILKQTIAVKRVSGVTTAGTFRFREGNRRMLDDIRFFVSRSSVEKAGLSVKLLEVFLYFISRIPVLNRMQKVFGNTRYRRFRTEGRLLDGTPLISFSEEIDL